MSRLEYRAGAAVVRSTPRVTRTTKFIDSVTFFRHLQLSTLGALRIVADFTALSRSVVMSLMNLVVALVAAMILFEPFTRAPVSRSMRFSARRSRARRSYMQAGIAFAAAMMVATSHPAPERISPMLVFGAAIVLVLASVYWAVRGKRLMKPLRMFAVRR